MECTGQELKLENEEKYLILLTHPPSPSISILIGNKSERLVQITLISQKIFFRLKDFSL